MDDYNIRTIKEEEVIFFNEKTSLDLSNRREKNQMQRKNSKNWPKIFTICHQQRLFQV